MAEIDTTVLRDFKSHAADLQAAHAERDKMFEQYREMYLLDWRAKNHRKLRHMQVTASVDFRNQVQGAVRLMVATDPQINVKPSERVKIPHPEKVEGWLNGILHASGRLHGEPIHYALITSGILYDEMHAAITPTADVVAHLEKQQPEGERARAYHRANLGRWQELAETTPFIAEPLDPCGGYPDWGPTGLSAYYRATETTAGDVFDKYGPIAGFEGSRSTRVTLHAFWDQVYTAVWCDLGDILCQPHGFPRVPIMAQILNGSRIFSEPENQRQPIGYTMLKSGLWHAQNLALTAMFTAVLNHAWTPTKVFYQGQDGARINVDPDDDLISVPPGSRLEWVQSKGLIDPGLREVFGVAVQKGYDSGIYPQALGAPAEGNTTYSELALLSQSGRLPLIGPQRRGGWGISDVCETMAAIARSDPRYLGGLTKADLPRGMEVAARLEVSLPQDKLQQANIVKMLTDGDNPLAPREWALENIMGVNNPGEMAKAAFLERGRDMLAMRKLQQLIQQGDQQQQAQQMAQRQQGGPGMQAGPGMAPGQAEAMGGGLPPQMAGIMPGAGRIMAPGPQDMGGEGMA